jgi:hypothetical protein
LPEKGVFHGVRELKREYIEVAGTLMVRQDPMSLFRKHPLACYNVIFFTVVILALICVAIFRDTDSDNKRYVEDRIESMGAVEKLKTLNLLINNRELTFRSGNLINTYHVIPNQVLSERKVNDPLESSGFYMTNGCYLLITGKNEYYFRDRINSSKWKKGNLPDGEDFNTSFYNRSRADFNVKIIPLISDKPSVEYIVLDPSGYRFITLDSSTNARIGSSAGILPANISNQAIAMGFKSRDSAWLLTYSDQSEEFEVRAGLGIKGQGRVNFVTFSDRNDLKIMAGKGVSDFRQIFTVDRQSDSVRLVDVTPDFLKKENFEKGRLSYLKNTLLFFGLKGKNLSVYKLRESERALTVDTSYQIRVPDGMFGNGNIILGYKLAEDLWLCDIMNQTSDEENRKLLHIRLDGKKIRSKLIELKDFPLENTNFNNNVLNILKYNEEDAGYSMAHVKNDSLYGADGSDSLFLRSLSQAYITSPVYSPDPEYIAIFYNGMAKVHARKNRNGTYEYEFIDKVSWPEDAFEVRPTPDVFFIAMSITLIATIYSLGFIFFRARFPKNSIDYEFDKNAIFQNIPLLKTKLKEIDNLAKSLKVRSDVMLSLGILFGVGGVLASIIVFQLMEDKITNSWQDPHIIISLVKPAILLVFVETFTFFFLKQYRIIFNEYKLFYSTFIRYLNYFHLLELNSDFRTRPELIAQINNLFLSEKIEMYESNTRTQINEFDNATWLKLVEMITNIQGKGGAKAPGTPG